MHDFQNCLWLLPKFKMALLLQNSLSLTTEPKRKHCFAWDGKSSPKANKALFSRRTHSALASAGTESQRSLAYTHSTCKTKDSKCLHFRRGIETVYRNQRTGGGMLHLRPLFSVTPWSQTLLLVLHLLTDNLFARCYHTQRIYPLASWSSLCVRH